MKKLLALMSLAVVAGAANAAIVYDNIEAPQTVIQASSSTFLTNTWGDQVQLVSAGKLDTMKFSLFNSTNGGANTASVLTATVNVRFYDCTTAYTSGAITAKPLLGNIDFNVNFGTGLAPGFYSIISATALAGLNVNLTQKIMMTQQVTASTGGSTRLGVVFTSGENSGSSIGDNFYQKTATAEGLFAFAAPNSNKLAMQIGVVPEPASMAVLGLGAAALLRRRNKKA